MPRMPREPRRMRRIPGYDFLQSVARDLNAEIAAVNASQTPSDVVRFTKSLDPGLQEQEHVCGGIAMGGSMNLDRELSFRPIDTNALGAPLLPTPPPLETIADELSALAERLHAANPALAAAALAALAEG